MFSLKIVDSDAFLDMPQSSQLLYFHLSMRADDDGFVGNPKKITRSIGANDDDMKILLAKLFLLSFESGVVVIKHWKIHNYIQNDRYQESQYLEEKNGLITKENGSYTECIQDVSKLDTQVRLGKDRLELGKDRLEEEKMTPSQEATLFFLGDKVYKDILEEFSKGNDPAFIENEFKKFVFYWTEKNKSGTRQKWQQQQTFEVKRRLLTWLNRSSTFNNKKESKIL